MTRRRSDPKLAVRLVIDASRCDGHAICALRCPELIALDEWGYANVDPRPAPTPWIAARALRAARSCPAGAMTPLIGDDAAT